MDGLGGIFRSLLGIARDYIESKLDKDDCKRRDKCDGKFGDMDMNDVDMAQMSPWDRKRAKHQMKALARMGMGGNGTSDFGMGGRQTQPLARLCGEIGRGFEQLARSFGAGGRCGPYDV